MSLSLFVAAAPWLSLALAAIASLTLLLGVAIVARRSLRHHKQARDRRLVEPHRVALMALVTDDEPAPMVVDEILGLDDETWRAMEPILVAMLRKVRGEARDAIAVVLTERGTIRQALTRLNSRRPLRRSTAAELLGSLGDAHHVGPLIHLLEDGRREVRIVAARALGNLEAPQATLPLLRTLTSARGVPPRIVAQSLARIGAQDTRPLVDALTSSDQLVRSIAAETLGLCGGIAAIPTLERIVLDDLDPEVRIRAARALGRLGGPSTVAPLAAAAQVSELPPLRAVAARALGDIGSPEAVIVLRSLLDDPVHRVALNAGDALARLGAAGHLVLRSVARGEGAPRAVAVAEMALALHAVRHDSRTASRRAGREAAKEQRA